jgi:hypothetical protein
MGMTAICPQCGHTEASSNRRGARLGTCTKCGTPMRAHTAGQAKGRYSCPVSGQVTTLGMRYAMQIDQPMRLVFIPGWDNSGREDDPDRPGWLRPARFHRDTPDKGEQEKLDRAAGRVFGPGCVFDRDYTAPKPDSARHGQAGVYLVPAPDADPAEWFVNERLEYKRCAGCTSMVAVTERTVMPEPWAPRHAYYYRRRQTKETAPGPHPAGTVACQWCDPRQADEDRF